MKNKNYIVVGGSKGIGLGVVNELLESNANVFTISRGEMPYEISNRIIKHYSIDVTQDFQLTDLPEIIDGIIYCPGNINLKPFNRINPNDFLYDYNLNLVGMVKILQQTINNLKKSESPSVVMYSSVAATVGMSFHSSTASSKSAVEGFVRAMAAEFAPKIRFNIISPSLTDTPLSKNLLSSEDKRKLFAEKNPLKRIGNIEDIVNMTMFLISSKSSYITGQVFAVDGGMNNLK